MDRSGQCTQTQKRLSRSRVRSETELFSSMGRWVSAGGHDGDVWGVGGLPGTWRVGGLLGNESPEPPSNPRQTRNTQTGRSNGIWACGWEKLSGQDTCNLHNRRRLPHTASVCNRGQGLTTEDTTPGTKAFTVLYRNATCTVCICESVVWVQRNLLSFHSEL